jgi:hypothetical protein
VTVVPYWLIFLAGFLWLILFRAYRKRAAGRLNASIGAGAARDMTGRGGF